LLLLLLLLVLLLLMMMGRCVLGRGRGMMARRANETAVAHRLQVEQGRRLAVVATSIMAVMLMMEMIKMRMRMLDGYQRARIASAVVVLVIGLVRHGLRQWRCLHRRRTPTAGVAPTRTRRAIGRRAGRTELLVLEIPRVEPLQTAAAAAAPPPRYVRSVPR
jgi:hypothetical protein